MTVIQLIEKLADQNPNAEILVENNSLYFDGLYTATNVLEVNGKVLIETDYATRE